jgi:hypothetical protein
VLTRSVLVYRRASIGPRARSLPVKLCTVALALKPHSCVSCDSRSDESALATSHVCSDSPTSHRPSSLGCHVHAAQVPRATVTTSTARARQVAATAAHAPLSTALANWILVTFRRPVASTLGIYEITTHTHTHTHRQ